MRRKRRIVEDCRRRQLRGAHTCLDARLRRIPRQRRALGGTQRRRDRDMRQPPFLGISLMLPVNDGFGRVDGGAAAKRDEGVDGGVGGDGVGGAIEVGDGRVLPDVCEGAGVVGGCEEGFEGADERGFGGEGGARYDESFGVGGWEGFEEVGGEGVAAVEEGFEVVGFVEACEGDGGGIHGVRCVVVRGALMV